MSSAQTVKDRSMRKSLEVVPLSDERLEGAADLVTACYRAERGAAPALPVRYEDPGEVLSLLRDASKRSKGVVAIHDDDVEGLLLGGAIIEFMGRSVYVPEWSHAACVDGRQETYRQMYAYLSRKWVEDGCFTHVISLLAHDREAIDAFFWMGFGLVEVTAIRDLSPVEGGRASVEIRKAGREDAEVITDFNTGLQRYLAAAPTFHNDREPLRAESWLADPVNSAWLAYSDGMPVGCIRIGPADPSAARFIRDERTAYIVHAFVEEGLRNAGIGTALLSRALDWARSAGYERCAVDFESSNTIACNFWLKHFQPVCLILYRRVDERVARAQGH
jgi:GNAT superfamily N-acetyltransferase